MFCCCFFFCFFFVLPNIYGKDCSYQEREKTTKIRAVVDASAKFTLFLNDCLYMSSNLLANIYNVLLRVRTYEIA